VFAKYGFEQMNAGKTLTQRLSNPFVRLKKKKQLEKVIDLFKAFEMASEHPFNCCLDLPILDNFVRYLELLKKR